MVSNFLVNFCPSLSRSTDVWKEVPLPEVRNDGPVPLTLDFLNPKSIGVDRLSRTILLCQVSGHYAALLPRRGPHIASHSVCLSVCLSVRPVRGSSFVIVYITTVLRANIQNRKTSVFDYRPASTLRTCGIFCFVYMWGPHIVRRYQPHKLVLVGVLSC